jgi:hypothetical protein
MFSVGGELSELVQGDESVFYICSKWFRHQPSDIWP